MSHFFQTPGNLIRSRVAAHLPAFVPHARKTRPRHAGRTETTQVRRIFSTPTSAKAPGPWLSLLIAVLLAAPAGAQELEPRAYSPNPIGANFIIQSYSYQTGDVLFDASLPFSDVEAKINMTVTAYGHTFGLFGRTAGVSVMVPYGWGSMEGNVNETATRITRSGFADMRARFTMNILGGPALKPLEFMQRKPTTTLGASFTVSIPTGEYYPDKFINIGTNRWSFKPEVGLSHPIGRWTLEGYAGVWFYTDNTNAYGGVVRKQDPLASFQGHVGYTFKPRLWLAWDFTYYIVGAYNVNGTVTDRQSNSRAGITLSVPIAKQHSIKITAARGFFSRIGSDFNTIGIAYQYFWLSRW